MPLGQRISDVVSAPRPETGQSGEVQSNFSQHPPWRSWDGAEHAFYLTGNFGTGVPEPGTLVLMGTGILGALAGLRRRF